MKRFFLILVVVGFLVAAVASTAFAADGNFRNNNNRCFINNRGQLVCNNNGCFKKNGKPKKKRCHNNFNRFHFNRFDGGISNIVGNESG